jgi:hypothetical protein
MKLLRHKVWPSPKMLELPIKNPRLQIKELRHVFFQLWPSCLSTIYSKHVAWKIMANSFTLRNMRNYSKPWDMEMISGIWNTTQCEPSTRNNATSNTSMQNNTEKLSRVPIYTKFERGGGSEVAHGDASDGNDFPLMAAVEATWSILSLRRRRLLD